jgi:nitrite reductase (NADH) small subunit
LLLEFLFSPIATGCKTRSRRLLVFINTIIMTITKTIAWFQACYIHDVPDNGGVCVKYKDKQIALFHFTRRGEWFASQNECPHRRQMALSRGMIGTMNNEPKIACPFHKKTFSLLTGECLSGDECAIKIYPVKVEDNRVYIGIDNDTDC